MVTSLSANRTRATTRVTTSTSKLAAQRHQTKTHFCCRLALCPQQQPLQIQLKAMHEIQMRRRRRLRYDFGKQAEQDTKYSHSTHTLPLSHLTRSHTHSHIALDSHSCLVLFVQLRGENKATTQFCIYSPQLLLSLIFSPVLACVAGPVGCGRARRITKTKLSTICARPFFAAIAAYLMVSVFSFSTSKIPIRQQHTHCPHTYANALVTCTCVYKIFTHTHSGYILYIFVIFRRVCKVKFSY